MEPPVQPAGRIAEQTLIALVYELLDAHDDTAQLLGEGGAAGSPQWSAHLDYLRSLQRRGRELLAASGARY